MNCFIFLHLVLQLHLIYIFQLLLKLQLTGSYFLDILSFQLQLTVGTLLGTKVALPREGGFYIFCVCR